MLDESGLAAPGWPLEHNWHLAVRRDREQTDLATDLLVEWLARDPILSDVDFASLLHRCVSLVCLVYVVYPIRSVTINGTEAEDQAIWLEYQNTGKQVASQFLIPILEGVAKAVLYCAHRTSTI
jgi:hypothetical protein